MKILFVILLVAVATSLSINQKCVSELSTIVPKIASLHAKVQNRKFVSSFKDLVSVLKSLVSVKNSCSGKDGIDLKQFASNIGVCLQGTYDLAQNAYKSYNEYEEDGFSDMLMDNLIELSHLVEPVIQSCWGEQVKTTLGIFLPDTCVNHIDKVAEVSLKIIKEKERPLLVTKGLINLRKLFKESRGTCPFLESVLPKKQEKKQEKKQLKKQVEEEDDDFEMDSDFEGGADLEDFFELFE